MTAGFRSPEAFSAFTALKISFMLILPLSAVVLCRFLGADMIRIIMAGCIAGVIGMILPTYILEKMVLSRIKRVTRELPDVMDLLVVAVEAGLGLPAAIKRVAGELVVSCPLLAEEMKILSLEMKVGVPREEALKNFAERTGAEDVKSLVTMLVQADRFGVSVGQSLRVHSEEVRSKKRQRLEESAAKIPLKLLFPVLFLIFPAIMAAMAGPALIAIMESMF